MAVVVRDTFLDVPDHKFLFGKPCYAARRCHSEPRTGKPDMPVSSLEPVLSVRSKRRTLSLASNSSTQSDLSSCPSLESLEARSSTADDSVKNRSEGRSETCNRVDMAATVWTWTFIPSGFPTQGNVPPYTMASTCDMATSHQNAPLYAHMWPQDAAMTYNNMSACDTASADGTQSMHKNTWAYSNSRSQNSARATPVMSAVEIQVGLQQPIWIAAKCPEGCIRVQDVLEDTTGEVTVDMKAALISRLASYVMALVNDENGNYVLQCAIKQGRQIELIRGKDDIIQFIWDELLVNVRRPAKDQKGIRSLQRCLEVGGPMKSKLEKALLEHAIELCKHQYGMFVMAHLVKYGTQDHITSLTSILFGRRFDLAQSEKAPYVLQRVDEVLKNGGVENLNAVLEAFNRNRSLLDSLAGDKTRYGRKLNKLQSDVKKKLGL